MKQDRGVNGVALYSAAILGLALSLAAPPVAAQSLGTRPEVCSTVNGRLACRPANPGAGPGGLRPYEQWQDGSPARASGSSSATRYRYRDERLPQYMGSYNSLYGFGR